jgi:hypothetical protein
MQLSWTPTPIISSNKEDQLPGKETKCLPAYTKYTTYSSEDLYLIDFIA